MMAARARRGADLQRKEAELKSMHEKQQIHLDNHLRGNAAEAERRAREEAMKEGPRPPSRCAAGSRRQREGQIVSGRGGHHCLSEPSRRVSGSNYGVSLQAAPDPGTFRSAHARRGQRHGGHLTRQPKATSQEEVNGKAGLLGEHLRPVRPHRA